MGEANVMDWAAAAEFHGQKAGLESNLDAQQDQIANGAIFDVLGAGWAVGMPGETVQKITDFAKDLAKTKDRAAIAAQLRDMLKD